MSTRPASGRSSPATSRSVVVLPAPVGPRSTRISPSGTCRLSSAMACVWPKRFETASSITSATGRPLVERRTQGAAGRLVEQGEPFGAEHEAGLIPGAHADLGGQAGLEGRALLRG